MNEDRIIGSVRSENFRKVKIGASKYTEIFSDDNPDETDFGHCYYEIRYKAKSGATCVSGLYFQKGAIREHGVNGIHNEDLISIVLDRLQCFQTGKYACEYNELAAKCLENALAFLRERTNERENRGVEGTHAV